jgi:hypothetical protein
MPKHSISEAAKLAGVSRSHFYKKYIRPGVISVEKDNDGNPQIDTAEVMRVFGGIHSDVATSVPEIQKDTPEYGSINTALQVEIQLLREQLTATSDREKWMQGKIDQLADQLANTTRLLEHKAAPEPPKKRWWQFS